MRAKITNEMKIQKAAKKQETVDGGYKYPPARNSSYQEIACILNDDDIVRLPYHQRLARLVCSTKDGQLCSGGVCAVVLFGRRLHQDGGRGRPGG